MNNISPRLVCLVSIGLTYLCTFPSLAFGQVDFAHDIYPILKKHCAKCHGGDEKEGDFSLNTRATLLAGGEHGPAIKQGDAPGSLLIQLVTSTDSEKRMPPEGEPLPESQVQKLKAWIAAGAPWENGLTFAKNSYEPPLKPRTPTLPPGQTGRLHPIDRILDSVRAAQGDAILLRADDSTFARRVWLDLHGTLPPVDQLQAFLEDVSPNKREKLIDLLLEDKRNYTEHWLTFWNDLLRNDYGGTGFITGGRKQISAWLYRSLIENKPYDVMARELISPTAESTGFADGIRWRGTVSAGQTVEIQFSQSVGQSFLGINLKCASCHDSFIDRWKLDDAYGLAAIYSKTPLEIHRCDKPIGREAKAAWLFPELGTIDPTLSQPDRLKRMAELMTHPENGRFTRTIVNRLWHRLMGRGIVEPVDAMQTQPWNEDLLDWLAVDFVEQRYDLKKMMRRICTSEAYQSQAEVVDDPREVLYRYRGPRGKRMTAEQFVDSVWQLCNAAPTLYDAPLLRGDLTEKQLDAGPSLEADWIWSYADANRSPGNERVTFRKTMEFKEVPTRSAAVVTCDNSFELFVNQKRVAASDQWDQVQGVVLSKYLKPGKNEIVLACKNGGEQPNPAGLFFEARWSDANGTLQRWKTDASWEWSSVEVDKNGKWKGKPEWKPAAVVSNPEVWMNKIGGQLKSRLRIAELSQSWMVRASLLKSDTLQRNLGRPNRDQIVTSRPNQWSTLEALDLNNASSLDQYLTRGAQHWIDQHLSTTDLIDRLYWQSLSRAPTDSERKIALECLEKDSSPSEQIQDLLWSLTMLPEFQIIR